LPPPSPPSTSVSLPPTLSPEILERLRQLELLSGKISAKQMEVYRAAIELDAIDEDVARTVEEYNRLVLSWRSPTSRWRVSNASSILRATSW